MEKYRNELGFLDLNSFTLNNNILFYNDKKYYYKKVKHILEIYNELIAEELAHDYNIRCAHYDLAEYNDDIGVISENFLNDNDKFILLSTILDEYFKDNSSHNNLNDIKYALENRYNEEIANKLVNELYSIFIFDILTANIDRHDNNLAIIENENISFSPLFDNEKILNNDSIYEGEYSLNFGDVDKFIYQNKEIIKNKLWIIDEENINKILEKVEYRIHSFISGYIKNEIKKRFSENKIILSKIIK